MSAQDKEDRKRLDEQVDSFADAAAAKEEDVFTAALAETQRVSSSAEDASSSSPGPQQPASVKAATDGVSLRQAAMRRIEAARKYAASRSTTPISPPADTPVSGPLQPTLPDDAPVEWGKSGVGSEKEVSQPHAHILVPLIFCQMHQ